LHRRFILGRVTSQRDLFANFERMRREMDELFGDVFERRRGLRGRGFSPRIDVYYTDNPPRAVVKVDLAAVDPADVALEIRGRQLLIAGERRPTEAGGRLYQQIEIEHGPFRRIVELGADVVADKASASYEDGVLQVEIPLADPEQSVRRVPIAEQ
jgi:HSP20 family protein